MEKMNKSTMIKMVIFKVAGGLCMGLGFIFGKFFDMFEIGLAVIIVGLVIYALSFFTAWKDHKRRKAEFKAQN